MRHLALFARHPDSTAVKTRLTPALPPALAAQAHLAMVLDALEMFRACRADQRWVYWVDGPGVTSGTLAPGMRERMQRGADLGARLEAAFAELLASPADRVVIIGADCPWITPALIERAFEALERADAAIAPAQDGGYVLVGLRHPAPALFRGIDWGTGRVHAQTMERARGAGVGVETLETLADLDTPADLVRTLVRLASAPGAGPPGLRAMLDRIGLLPRRAISTRPPESAAR